jgi:hypothetical protein
VIELSDDDEPHIHGGRELSAPPSPFPEHSYAAAQDRTVRNAVPMHHFLADRFGQGCQDVHIDFRLEPSTNRGRWRRWSGEPEFEVYV